VYGTEHKRAVDPQEPDERKDTRRTASFDC